VMSVVTVRYNSLKDRRFGADVPPLGSAAGSGFILILNILNILNHP